MSFHEFRMRKERERLSRFEPKSKKTKIAKGKAKETEVSINIGFTKLDKAGNFKKNAGARLYLLKYCLGQTKRAFWRNL